MITVEHSSFADISIQDFPFKKSAVPFYCDIPTVYM